MGQSTSSKRTLLWLAVLLVLFIAFSYLIAPDQPEEYPDFASESPSPTGVKAFYTYLQDETGAVSRWTQSPASLPEEDDQLLIMAQPLFTPETAVMSDYISFMSSGNTIVLLKTNPDGMFGLESHQAQGMIADDGVVQDNNGRQYQADKNARFRIDPNKGDAVLLEDDAGAIAIERDYGDGRLIVATEPGWLTNDNILSKDHLPLMLSLIQFEERAWDTVYFDAYVHGEENASSLISLYPDWLLVVAFQMLSLTLIWLWHHGKRFGRVLEPREESVRFSDERIRALAAWYQRGNRYADSLMIQSTYLKQLLQERWGIPYYQEWQDMARQLVRRSNVTSEEDIQPFLDGLTDVLKQKRVSKKDFVTWSEKIDRLRKEVEEG